MYQFKISVVLENVGDTRKNGGEVGAKPSLSSVMSGSSEVTVWALPVSHMAG